MPYTVEWANQLADELRALPPIDDSKRILDKQGVIRLLAAEIVTLQQRGYTIDQVAEGLTTRGLDITTPTLKSYLQRVKKASAKGAQKAPRRPPPAAGRGREAARSGPGPSESKPSEKAVLPVAKGADRAPPESPPKSTASEFITTDRERI